MKVFEEVPSITRSTKCENTATFSGSGGGPTWVSKYVFCVTIFMQGRLITKQIVAEHSGIVVNTSLPQAERSGIIVNTSLPQAERSGIVVNTSLPQAERLGIVVNTSLPQAEHSGIIVNTSLPQAERSGIVVDTMGKDDATWDPVSSYI
ncbi:hypothetical protein EDB19DRAFT_2010410 [Suillus lakei]|nr:hypothetical protein EDB19DRAFT_2010410 [Suillus lakei]